MYTLGIDIGSTTSKCAVIQDGTKLTATSLQTGGLGTGGPEDALAELWSSSGLTASDMARTIVTGYGRKNYEGADGEISELTAHALGGRFVFPDLRTVIDIGGQDAKVIALSPSGKMVNFVMNDKCAAGTGRFLEMTMSRVGSDITSIDTFVEGAEPVTINSMCAVFAESEIIGLLAQETPPGSIALGCIYSICRRTAIFAQKLAPEHPKVFFSGGLAQSQVVREVLARYLGVESVTAHPLCQYNGAIGAAVLGWKQVNR